MAQVPSTDEVRAVQAQSAAEENEKTRLQLEQNKGFENHGQGVIPEEIWQNLPGKKAENEEDV